MKLSKSLPNVDNKYSNNMEKVKMSKKTIFFSSVTSDSFFGTMIS